MRYYKHITLDEVNLGVDLIGSVDGNIDHRMFVQWSDWHWYRFASWDAPLKQQEEELRREQEAIRKKAKLKVDEEGQVVDPELKKEMEEEEEEEEED